ncbi:histidine phosphatase superfamily [Lactarius sanguifluus]|nr:histidine phosphatase superfamily [Lactarius sanguifluus]
MSGSMPRLIVIRHGETEWSLNGQTGRSDIPLTERGVEQIKSKAPFLVGDGTRPRYFHHLTDHLPQSPNHQITELVREWDYGDYEGLKSHEINGQATRLVYMEGWVGCCPNGESVREYHRKWKEEGQGTRDVVIVAHGHFNRCLIARWVGLPLAEGTKFNVEPAGFAILSYNHNSLQEPALNALNLNAM